MRSKSTKPFLWIVAFLVCAFAVQVFVVFFSRLSAQSVPPKRECRAVWVTTLNNMDWPSQKNLAIHAQKDEFVQLLDRCQAANFNAVIVQIRPSADAFYKSPYEPWSEWLTGRQGKAPKESDYDPLHFMVEEAHKRNMEFHAWLNPLRAVYNTQFCDVHDNHITKQQPGWFLDYGTMKMFDPGLPQVRDYLVKIVEDVVQRYDIDGIHFDDYFYPFPIPDEKLSDWATFRKYKGKFDNLADWRRDNITKLVQMSYQRIKQIKPYVKFGISPAGVWRNIYDSPLGSNTRGGITSYDHLNADIRLWLEQGWVDYVVPQVYFSTKLKTVNYRTLVSWWNKNAFGRNLYIGHAAFKVYKDRDKSWYKRSEIPYQIQYNRQLKNINGSVFFRAKSFMENRGHFRDSLQNNYYRLPALQPSMPWIDKTPPNSPVSPQIKRTLKGIRISWQVPEKAPDGQPTHTYLLYRIERNKGRISIDDPANILAMLPPSDTVYLDTTVHSLETHEYLLTALDRMHNESHPVMPERVPLLVVGKWPYKDFQYYLSFYQKGLRNYFGWLVSL